MSKFPVRLPAAEYYIISGPTYLPSAATKYHNCVIIALTYLPSAEYYVILECSLSVVVEGLSRLAGLQRLLELPTGGERKWFEYK